MPRTPRAVVGPLLAVALTLLSGAARPEPTVQLRWDPAWGDFSTGEVVATGVAAAIALGTSLVDPLPDHWRGGVGADEGARDALRFDDASDRRLAAGLSDVTLVLSLASPYLVDALGVAALHRDSPEVGLQMALVDTEVLAVVMAIGGIVKATTSRERPYGRTCGLDGPDDGADCDGPERYRSFFSGHTALTFAAAATACSHHLNLDLFQDPTADALACTGGFLVAGFTGLMRVTSDRHYLSDVLVGAGVGTLVGLGLPWLLHYRFERRGAPDGGPSDGVTLMLAPAVDGAAVVGTF
ncbi:MAG: phosphatase PAP2 family protein [Deltaproteobacteria bacterium]|nr:MAG: phosphatase PAP2 family protein [Deltaproteobacteria bacterium]